MKRPLDRRSFRTVAGSQHVDSIRSLNTNRPNIEIEKEAKMTEQTDEQMSRRKETSGTWVLLVFVVLILAVVTVALVTQ